MSHQLRALMLDPVTHATGPGGLNLALADLRAQLTAHGWSIVLASETGVLQPTVSYTTLSRVQQLNLYLRLRERMPQQLRRYLAEFLQAIEQWQRIDENLAAIERLLADRDRYAVVLYCAENVMPGALALTTALHQRTVVISLGGLGRELAGRRFWPLFAAGARLQAGRHVHPALYRPIDPQRIRCAVFASNLWRDEALQAGLPAAVAHIIPFGIPPTPPAPSSAARPTRWRLLYVGRLTADKGLHLFIAALPQIRAALGDVQLTAITSDGPPAYRQRIAAQISRLNLHDAVKLQPAQPRTTLQTAYAAHDLLCFYSEFNDPVALVLMEAFSAGLPVIASAARPDALLVRDGVTCRCYNPRNPESIARAVVTLLTDRAQTHRLAANAAQLVHARFSLAAMGNAYDRLLRTVCN